MLLKNLFSESVLKKLHVGPLKSYLSTFISLLSEQGYTKFSIKVKIRFVAKFRTLDLGPLRQSNNKAITC
jgi:hypothetical protein